MPQTNTQANTQTELKHHYFFTNRKFFSTTKNTRSLFLLGTMIITMIVLLVGIVIGRNFFRSAHSPAHIVDKTAAHAHFAVAFAHKVPVMEVFEDPFSHASGEFERSSGGMALARSFLYSRNLYAHENNTAYVVYRLSNVLDSASASKSYSTRVIAALLAIEKSSLPKNTKVHLWYEFHQLLFSQQFQPTGTHDHSNTELVTGLVGVANRVGIAVPEQLRGDIISGKYITSAQAEAKANSTVIETVAHHALPCVITNSTVYTVADPKIDKKLSLTADDISSLDFIPARAAHIAHNPIPTVEIFEDPLCPVCGYYEQSLGSATLTRYVRAGQIQVTYRLVNFLDRASSSGNYSTRIISAFAAIEQSELEKIYKNTVLMDFHEAIFSSHYQPEEQGTHDLTNQQIARLIVTIAHDNGIIVPSSLINDIESGKYLSEGIKIGRENLELMRTYQAEGTPDIWVHHRNFGLHDDISKFDIGKPEFIDTILYFSA